MVGYKKEDIMSAHQKLIAGVVSGIVTRFITQPLDVLKIRSQLQKRLGKGKSKSLFGMTKSIFNDEGITAFWHGHNLGQMHSILSTTTQFYVYELTTTYAFKKTNSPRHELLTQFFCGICSGCCTAVVVTPLEVIRVRQVLIKEQYKGFFNGAKTVYQSGGFFAFYEGLSAGLLMLGPQTGITFAVFSVLQPIILSFAYTCNGKCTHAKANAHRPEHLLFASSVAAAIAGFTSKFMTYPLDLAKRRLQIASHKPDNKFYTPPTSQNVFKCERLVECIAKTWKLEGLRGLYRGLEVTIYKAQLTNAIAFTTYELVCYFIREIGNTR